MVSLMRFRVRRNVDLPQPEGPINAVIRFSRNLEVDVVQSLESAVEEVQIRRPSVLGCRLRSGGSRSDGGGVLGSLVAS